MTKVSLIAAAALFVTVGTTTFILAQKNPNPETVKTPHTTKVKIESTVNTTPLSATIPSKTVESDVLISKNVKETLVKSLVTLDMDCDQTPLSDICMLLSVHSPVPVKADPACEKKVITIKCSKKPIFNILKDVAALSDCALTLTEKEILFQPIRVTDKGSVRNSLLAKLDIDCDDCSLDDICTLLSVLCSIPVKVDPSCAERILTIKCSNRKVIDILNDVALGSNCSLKITDQEIAFQPKQVEEKVPTAN
jgi:hypothetical protein